jgi:alpha-glucosidase
VRFDPSLKSERPSVVPVRGPAASPDWWKHGVLYQIYPRSFQDSDGDGVGDLAGITRRLDHLNGRDDSLGVDGIWLSPFYRSPMKDFGYDVSDHRDVDPVFGSLGDFDELLGQAHERGIRVVVDLVPNHTSDQHPWFVEARASRSNPKRDWYVWADPRPNGAPPNNWRSAFQRVGRAWTLDQTTGQYYLHHFLPEQPDLDWWNPEVRQAFDDVMRFWLDRGVDGFRIDVASLLVKDKLLRNNPRLRIGRLGRRVRNLDLPEVHDIHREWRRLLDEYGDRMAVGEVSEAPARHLVRYYAGADQLHLAFYFHFLAQPWRAGSFQRAVEELEALLPEGTWPTYTLSNHDRSRHASRFGRGNAPLAALMLLTLRGTPFLYYGEEIGMVDVPIPRERHVDVADRDKSRTPMQWDGTHAAGFTTGEPWLPVAEDAYRVNVAAQREDPGSLLSLYRGLIASRRASPALRSGSYRGIRTAPVGVFAYERSGPDERLLVALNFTDRERQLSVPGMTSGSIQLSTSPARTLGAASMSPLVLAPREGVLVRAG